MTPAERFWAKVNKQGPINPVLGTRCWLWTACVDGRGYGKFDNRVFGTWQAHRNAWAFVHGAPPTGLVDHHRHCPKICVNPDHLRPVTHKQNMENLAGERRNSRSQVRGVRWHRGAWEAVVRHNHHTYYLGRYASKGAAELAAVTKRNQLFTHNDADQEMRCGNR